MTIPSIQELLKAGVHFGHRESRRHPKMESYLFGTRNNVNIIDLEKTREQLRIACDAARALAKEGKAVLFIGTKDQARPIVHEAATRAGMPYAVGRWLGGTLTNFAVISKLIQKYRSLVRSRDTGELEQKYTKHEQSEIAKEIVRLEEAVGGIAELNQLPDALFIVDIREEDTAVRESRKKNVTTFAVCDSNVDPSQVTYPIPGNDDSVSSIRLLVNTFTDAIIEGNNERARTMAQEVASAAPAETQPVEGEEKKSEEEALK